MKTKLLVGFCLAATLFGWTPSSRAGGRVAAWGGDDFHETILPVGIDHVQAISAGWRHNLALKSDGTVVAWGYIGGGAVGVPSDLLNVKAISAGGGWSLALKSDGTVEAWSGGTTNNNAYWHVSGLSNITAIAAGWYHWLALKSDGTLATYGVGNDSYNPANPTNMPPGLSNIVAIAAGLEFSVVLKADGTVVAWGDNRFGQTSVPPDLSNVVAIAASCVSSHVLALKDDGTVVAWGANSTGQTDVPAGLSNVIAIAAGSRHSLALKADGTVVGWGANGNFYPNSGQATPPPGLANVTAISAGEEDSLALVFDGPVQITQDLQPTNQALPLGSSVTYSIAATGAGPLGYQWYLDGQAITNNSRITGTAGNRLVISNLQISDTGNYTVIVSNALGSVVSSTAALAVISPPVIKSESATNLTVGAGTNVYFSVLADGTPPLGYQWEYNGLVLTGQLLPYLGLTDVQTGQSGTYSLRVTNAYGSARADFLLTVTNTAPVILTQPAGRTVVVGTGYTLAVTARGSLPLSYQWRFNGVNIAGATRSWLTFTNLAYNQSGYYDVAVSNPFGTTYSAKVLLTVAQTVVQVWSSSASWGYGAPTNVPANLTNAVAVAAGNTHILALKADGTAATWGIANYTSPSVLNIPPTATNLMAVAAGGKTSMGLRTNGTVLVWGDNAYGQTNVPAAATNIVAIADGGSDCLAVKSDGTVIGWGNNAYGQASPPPGLSNVVSVAAGATMSYAVRDDGTIAAWGRTNFSFAASNLVDVLAVSGDSGGSGANFAALKSDGRVVTWNYQGLTGAAPSAVSNAVAVAAGYTGAEALTAYGTVLGFRNLGGPTMSVDNLIAVACGGIPSFVVTIAGNGSPFITLEPASQTVTAGADVQFHVRAAGYSPFVYRPPFIRHQPLSYQWQFNGLNLPGATNADLIIANARGFNVGDYQVIVTNVLGAATSRVARLVIPYSGSLATALDATNLAWTSTPANAGWFAQIAVSRDGDAAQSGPITDGQRSTLQTTVTGPGLLTFWWKVSSEQGYDFLEFFIDSTNQAPPAAQISGEVGWQQLSFNIPSGTHLLSWVYAKDPSVSAGQDAGWVDQVSFNSMPRITIQPQNQVAWAGSTAVFQAGAQWSGIASLQWLKNGTNLANAHSLRLSLTNLTRRDSGSYCLQIIAAAGRTTSSNATLTVLVPQHLRPPRLLPDGTIVFGSGDADGGLLQPGDLAELQVQVSSNLLNWSSLPTALTLSNGLLQVHDSAATNRPMRFYRIIDTR